MKKIFAALLIACTLAFSGCGAVDTLSSMALGKSASETPFPSTVQSPLPSQSTAQSTKNYVSALPSGSSKATVSPSPAPSASSTAKPSSQDLNPGDVIKTVQSNLPIGIQFLIQQIQSLFGALSGQTSQPSN
ncbi:MAG: hypothetical protein WCP73_07860 [Eubacteriales bacterium]